MSKHAVDYLVTYTDDPNSAEVTVRSDKGIYVYTVPRRPILIVDEP